MTDTHITTDELVFIEAYFHHGTAVAQIAKKLGRARQTIHNVITHFKAGHTAIDYYQRYKENKKRCGRKQSVLPTSQQKYIEEKVAQGWTPDVIVGRQEMPIDCSSRTLYRMFKRATFDVAKLPMQGKRKPNGHRERRGRQAFRRSGATFPNGRRTIQRSIKNSAIWRATPLSVCDIKARHHAGRTAIESHHHIEA